ncbi:MAG TPA: ferredoxin reductase family protein [Acidimicrobiales bacterium]|nr:ferredoxin reductase family protein [Acidimicrobiales bacterium]
MSTQAAAPPQRVTTRDVGRCGVLRLTQAGRESLVFALVVLGALGVIYMWWHDTAPASVQGFGPWLTAAGRVTGLVGTYLIVIEVLIMGRVPWLDRAIGMDRLVVWHRRNGEYAICLLVAHAVLIIWGYAVTAHEGLVKETTSVVLSYPDMLAATVGLGLLVLVGVLSARAVRRRVSYQTWYFVHLYTYIALALSFAHQFNTGVDFATHPLNRAIWIVMYGVVAALLIGYRVVRPITNMARHRFVVVGTVSEGPGLTSVYVSGRRLWDLDAEAGQFFMWRFLTRDGWWQAHPFSLSAAPNGRWLRLTAKTLGDHSGRLARLRPGTKVMLEGPYGNFTRHRRRRRKVLLIGAGVGITPLRALFETFAVPGADVALLYRASHPDELALRRELDEIAAKRKAKIFYLVGPRDEHPEYLTPAHLQLLVRDIGQRDVYVCGPGGFTEMVSSSLHDLGLPGRQVHTESFEL